MSRRTVAALFVGIFALLFAPTSNGQGIPTEGRHFYLGASIIQTSDADFGRVVVGMKNCSRMILVTNLGPNPFTLLDYTFSPSGYFSMSVGSAVQLPRVLEPGDSLYFGVCYTPFDTTRDSTNLIWITDIPKPYDTMYKYISKLTGQGAVTDISWDRDSLNFIIPYSQYPAMTQRVYLRNAGNISPIISELYVQGLDVQEFYIPNTQLGKRPMDFQITPSDSIYVDVRFSLRYCKPTYEPRIAHLFAKIEPDLLIYMTLYGKIDSTQTSVRELPVADFLITPNPLTGDALNVSFTSLQEKKLSFTVYDVLGREVAFVREKVFSAGKNTLPIAIGDVAAGMYILRVSDGSLTKSLSFRVVR